MRPVTRVLVPILLAVTAVSTIAYAQSSAPSQQQRPQRERPSAETMQRLQDGKFAMAKAALKLTDAQQKLWAPVEAQMRTNQAARLKVMEERRAERQKNAARPPLPDRIDRMSAALAQRAEQVKAFSTAFRPFHDSLTEEQKAVMGPVLAQLTGGGRHMRGGHRWAGGPRGGAPAPQ